MNDLNQQSEDVTGIFSKIDELRQKGYAMLRDVPAGKRTCAIKVQHRVDVIMERATEGSDQCIALNVESIPNQEINVRSKAKRHSFITIYICCVFVLRSPIKRIAFLMFYTKPI